MKENCEKDCCFTKSLGTYDKHKAPLKFLESVPMTDSQTVLIFVARRSPAGEKLQAERKVKGAQLDFIQKLSKFLVSFCQIYHGTYPLQEYCHTERPQCAVTPEHFGVQHAKKTFVE